MLKPEAEYAGQTFHPARDKKPRYVVKQDGNSFAVTFDGRERRKFCSLATARMFADGANKQLNDPTSSSED